MPGPVPNRSDQRRRRNSPPADRVEVDDEVRGPSLKRGRGAGRRFYESLRRSGQAQFYEPSDWQLAALVAAAIDSFVEEPRATLLDSIAKMSTELLASEGARRRLRLELEHGEDEPVTPVTWADDARRRFRAS